MTFFDKIKGGIECFSLVTLRDSGLGFAEKAYFLGGLERLYLEIELARPITKEHLLYAKLSELNWISNDDGWTWKLFP